MIRSALSAGLLLTLLLLPPAAFAQTPDLETCQESVNREMAKEHHIFRSVIFGIEEAEDADVGEVRYSTAGNAWYKVDDSQWRSVADGFESTTWSDTQMDAQSVAPPRKGLLETKRVTTSELVPFIGQSLRAFQCRTEAICDIVRKSVEQDGSAPVSIVAEVHGCREIPAQTFPLCHLRFEQGEEISDRNDAEIYCDRIGRDMLEQEAAVMELTVQYDAAYRTMLQLAGNFDLFLQEFRTPLVNSLRQMVNLVGSFNRIPCFLSSCDASPPPTP